MILMREGIPLRAILATSRGLQAGLDKLASLVVELVTVRLLDRSGGPPPREVARLAGAAGRLRPVARIVIGAEFARAMDRQARVTYSEIIPLLAARDRPWRSGGPGTSGLSEGPAAPDTEAAA
jgi:hypothetical protein